MSNGVKAGEAYVELNVKNNLKRQLSQASDVFRSWASSIGVIGGAISAAAGAGLGVFSHMAKSFADAGSKLFDFSKRTGVSAETLSGLGYAAEQSGTTLEAVAKSLSAMNRFTTALAGGNEVAAKTLADLGISAADFLKSSPEQRLGMVADALDGIDDPAIRAGMAMKLFGKAGVEILPMLEGGSAALRAFTEEAERLGVKLSDDDSAAAEKFGDALGKATIVASALYRQIGASLAPALEVVANVMTGSAAIAIRWVKANRAAVVSLAAILAATSVAGFAIVALAAVTWSASIAMGAYTAITTAATAISSGCTIVVTALAAAFVALQAAMTPMVLPFALLTVALVGLAAALAFAAIQSFRLSDIGGHALDRFGASAKSAFTGAVESFTAFATAMGSGNIEGAMKIAAAGVHAVWKKTIIAISELFVGLREFITSIWRSIQQTSTNAVLSVARAAAGASDGLLGTNRTAVVNAAQAASDAGYNAQKKNDKLRFDSERYVLDLAGKAVDANRRAVEDGVQKKGEEKKGKPTFDRFEMPEIGLGVKGQSSGAFNAVAATNLGRTPQAMLEKISKELEKANKLAEKANKLLEDQGAAWGT